MVHDKSGMTLVELVVLTGLFVVVGGLAINFFLATLTGRAKATANVEVQEQARFAMQKLVYEIRRSADVDPTTDFGVNLATTGGATLDLDNNDVALDPTSFQVVGGVLVMDQGATTGLEITSDDVQVTELTLTDRSTGNGRSKHILITLTVGHPDPSGTSSLDISYTLEPLPNFATDNL